MNNDKIVKDTQDEINNVISELSNKDKNTEMSEDEQKEYLKRITKSFINSTISNGVSLSTSTVVNVEQKKRAKLDKIFELREYYFNRVRILKKDQTIKPIDYIINSYIGFIYHVVSSLSEFPIVTKQYFYLKDSCLSDNSIPEYYSNKHFINLTKELNIFDSIKFINRSINEFAFNIIPILMGVPKDENGLFYTFEELNKKFNHVEKLNVIHGFQCKEFDLEILIEETVSEIITNNGKGCC